MLIQSAGFISAYDVLGLYYGFGRAFFNPASAKVLSRFEELRETTKNYTIEATPDDRSGVLQQGVVPWESIVNEEGHEDLLKYWRENEKTFPTLTKMAKDVLNIQASSTASERAFSVGRFQIGEHRHSLAGDSLEIAVLFRDWIRAERRRCGQPEINEEEDNNYNDILSDSTGSEVDQFDQQILIPTEDPHEIVKKLERV